MINIVVFETNNKITAFEISGHANSGPYGYDLVCAAVSAVSFGSINAVFELCQIELEISQAGEGGYLYVVLPINEASDKLQKAQLIFEAMIVSLQTIEREYNEFMQIKWK